MKIRPGSDSDTQRRLLDVLGQDAVRLQGDRAKQLSSKLKQKSASSSDTVNIELAKSINAELDPESIDAQRSARVEELKELIANGQYNPSSELVAEAVGREIVFEILSQGENSTEGN